MVDKQAEQLHGELTAQGGQFDRYLSIPWVESPFFETELASRRDLNEGQRELLRHYNKFGYITLDHVTSDDLAERIKSEVAGLFNPDVVEGPASYYRIQDAWKTSAAVRELALNEKILATLRLLYGREPVPFQTLNFMFGSQQVAHSDAILFNSLPAGYMCGVWVALEDVDHDNGPLFYYPGSHKLPEYYPEDFRDFGDNPDDFFNHKYPRFTQELMKTHQFSLQELHVRKGGALIWASNLVHGGMPRLDEARTRWSQVTHYFFKDCIYYVPLYSNTIAGELFLRDVPDFHSNASVPQTFNRLLFHKTPIGNGRSKISFGPEIPAKPANPFPAQGVAGGVAGPEDDASVPRLVYRLRNRLLPRGGLFRSKSRASIQAASGAVLPIKESSDMIFYVDSFEDKAASFSMVGWAFLRSARFTQGSTIQVVLRSERDCFLFDCQKVARPDVAIAHQLTYPDWGFQFFLEKRDLPPGRYRVGLVIRRDGQEPALRFTDQTVNVP